MRSSSRLCLTAQLTAMLALGVLAGELSAQSTGTLRGRVTAAGSSRPLPGAQVYLPGSGRGTSTNAAGEYQIVNVPVGTHQVRAQTVGFGAQEKGATVTAGQSVSLDFQLQEQVLALDEVVVTGTAGAARKREVGNSIAQIKLDKVAEPIADVNQLLQSRTPGMVVTESSGMVGSGSQIRLRGSVSISQSNQPLIYIDGVRVKSDAYQKNVPPGDFSGRSGNVTASPLSDVNPQDIDRIEVIKGAAATTLYGTEASAGVIQIFTKRGKSGAARWNAEVSQGFSTLMRFAPHPRPYLNIDDYSRNTGSWLDRQVAGTGIAPRQAYSLSVSGGSEQMQYFVSGNFDRATGVLPLDEQDKVGVRGNFSFSPLPKVTMQWNTSYAKNSITNTPAGNNAHGLTLNAFRQERNYFGTGSVETVKRVLDYDINTWIDRFITGGTVNWDPTDRFTSRITVGYDLASQENRNLRPYGFVAAPRGILSDQRYSNESLTFDYVGSLRLPLPGDFSSSLSFGAQSVTNKEVNTIAKGDDLPGPGAPTVSNTVIQRGVEDRTRIINAGLFGQLLTDFRDRYFLTLGFRVDGNSAFGQDFGLQFYPKVSGSYVISDEPFWPEAMGTMKLRAAYGVSGRAPGAFDAVKTWDAVGYNAKPAFVPRNLGNAKLGPERTAETELGFDASFLQGRVTSELTYYNSHTTDALIAVRQAPSFGWSTVGGGTSQLMNVGQLQNKGIELALNAAVVDRDSWGFDLGGSVYTNRSEVLDLGDASEFSAGGGWIKEGWPIMAIRGHKVLNSHLKMDPVRVKSEAECGADRACIVKDVLYGPQQPTLVLGMNSTLRLPGGVQLTARGEYQGGAYIEDGASGNALQRAVKWPTCNNAYSLMDAKQNGDLTAWERKFCIQRNYENDFLVYPKDFFKLRELTLLVPVTRWVPRASSANFTLSARNWYTWKNSDFLMFDPEMVGNEGFGGQNTSITEHIPPTASLVAALRLSF